MAHDFAWIGRLMEYNRPFLYGPGEYAPLFLSWIILCPATVRQGTEMPDLKKALDSFFISNRLAIW